MAGAGGMTKLNVTGIVVGGDNEGLLRRAAILAAYESRVNYAVDLRRARGRRVGTSRLEIPPFIRFHLASQRYSAGRVSRATAACVRRYLRGAVDFERLAERVPIAAYTHIYIRKSYIKKIIRSASSNTLSSLFHISRAPVVSAVCLYTIKSRITETKICAISQRGDKLRANYFAFRAALHESCAKSIVTFHYIVRARRRGAHL